MDLAGPPIGNANPRSGVRPSLFLRAPDMAPRTVCACQPVAATSLIEGRPLARCSRAIIAACLVSLRCLGLGRFRSRLRGRLRLTFRLSMLTPMAYELTAVRSGYSRAIAGLAPDRVTAADIGIDFFKQAAWRRGLDHLGAGTALELVAGAAQQVGRLAAALRTTSWVSESLVIGRWLLRVCRTGGDRRLLRP